LSIAEQFISDVLSGKQVAGPYIVKACQRHVSDLETAASRGLYFDADAGVRVAEFIETFCTPPNQTDPMILMPWEHALSYISHGWKRDDGTRRFRRIYLEVAKKNGKTAFAAALALYHLVADGELSARVFISATTRKQSAICFKEAVAMRERNPDLKAAIQQSGIEPVLALYIPGTGSRLSMMSRDAASEDGALVSCAVMDELHRWTAGSNLYSVLRYGGRTRPQPMIIETTTAGSSAGGTSLCWAERSYGTKVLDGHLQDDEFAPFIFSMADKDDWKDPANWIKSNPSLGHLFPLETIQKEIAEAMGKPTSMGEAKRFALNMWSSDAENPAIELSKWDACCREDIANHPDPKRLRAETIAELRGRPCFGALDLAPKLDTSALVLLFPPLKTTERWRTLEYFWCPKDNIEGRVKRDHVPYDRWADDGFITTTDGNLTDVRFIAEQITEINKLFDLKELAYDSAWSSELIRMLGESGFPMQKFVAFPQTPVKMNGPCLEFMRKTLRKEFAHDCNPIMRWQVSNLRWNTQKGTNFIKPDRDSKREKIDGCASLIMALGRALDPENVIKPRPSFFCVSA
jgi:phage terminase large subunit-like protein